MIADLKPYAEYKESGLPWLGKVPGHWDVRKPRQVGSLLKGVGGTKEDALPSGVPCVRYGELYTTHTYFVRQPKTFIHPKRAANYTPLHYGDVLFAASGETLEDIGKSAVSLIDGTAVCGGDVIILRPTIPVHAPFLGYVMDCRPSANQKATMGRGTTVKHIYPDELKHLLFPLPPVPEQEAIARFLDWANGRLERTIRAKRKVIALLGEQKQAIIHRAVTRGIDPSVPLKPSGIPWLGDIPSHWALKRFKFLAMINSGQVDPRRTEYRDLVLIAPNHIQSGSGRLLRQETADEQGADSGKYLVSRGQVIYSKIRPNLRKATIAPCDCLCSADMYPIAPTTGEVSTDYLLFLLLSQPFTRFAVDTSMRVAMPKVNREALANCLMWYPSRQEQEQILEFMVREGTPLESAISRLEREIELLREYRTRLVADVVTGKLDVREAAARLPDEAAPEVSDDDSDLGAEADSADEQSTA